MGPSSIVTDNRKGADRRSETPQFDAPLLSRVWRRDEDVSDGRQEDYLLPLRKGVKSEYGNDFTARRREMVVGQDLIHLNTAGTWMMKSSSVPNADAIRVIEPYILEVSLSGPNALLSVGAGHPPQQSRHLLTRRRQRNTQRTADPWAKE